MKIFILISSILLFISCSKSLDPLENCTTFQEEGPFSFRLAEFYSKDIDNKPILLEYHTLSNTFPGVAELTVTDNFNYNLTLISESLSNEHPHLSIDIQEEGNLDFKEGDPFSVPGNFGGWQSKDLEFQFNSTDGTSSEYIETSFFCDRISLTYAKRINERDSISIRFYTD